MDAAKAAFGHLRKAGGCLNLGRMPSGYFYFTMVAI
jgi:hypothetical protein